MTNDMHIPLQKLLGTVGDALYFHHIHSAKGPKASMNKGDACNLEVEGKARRMVVLGKKWWFDLSSIDTEECQPEADKCHWYPVRGRPGYLVVELRGGCPNGRKLWYLGPYKRLLDARPKASNFDKETWIGLLPMVYPAECCSHRTDQRRDRIPREVVDQIKKELNLRGLGFDQIDPQTQHRG